MIVAENTIPVGLHLMFNSVGSTAEKSMLTRWQKEWNAFNSKNERRSKILAAVENGYDSYKEIASETGIPEDTLRKLIPDLVRSRQIVERKIKPPDRKTEYRFELADSES